MRQHRSPLVSPSFRRAVTTAITFIVALPNIRRIAPAAPDGSGDAILLKTRQHILLVPACLPGGDADGR
ncbi:MULTISPECIES: hypothetical protein [Brucella]|uniref:Uncharacterized protein n=2 Tax=Brucella TaxID=234 RepID=A0A256GV13_9HYPH|nr:MULTISPECIES: hypothetical protein [Brucella]KAB2704494.1 hypothetical protein F9L03_07590 [Brucella lupini]KAB2763189.1 hypothetical protein F9L04_20860 [Brucella anthropi]OYR30401.1 hypothetical protein CES86_1725 [Brucella lupini]